MIARTVGRFALTATLLSLTSCMLFDTPFDTNIHKFNEQGPQEPAAITVSDPQIFARETLINDRLVERRLLDDLLKESQKIDFRDKISTPGIIRDVETLEAVRVALDLSFDPKIGRDTQRAERLAKIDNDIQATEKETDLLKRQAELVQARKALKDARDAARGIGGAAKENGEAEGTQNSTSPASTPENTSDDQTPDNTDGGKQQTTSEEKAENGNGGAGQATAAPRAAAVLSALNSQIDDLDTRLAALRERFGKERAVKVPIPDAERSRDAYRAELRQRLNAINLDDLHDYDGNSLYRMQFRATVMPGRHKDKFGIARLTFQPPYLTGKEVDSLYFTWLLHLAHRLNYGLPAIRNSCPQTIEALLRLGDTKLVDIVKVTYSVSESQKEPPSAGQAEGSTAGSRKDRLVDISIDLSDIFKRKLLEEPDSKDSKEKDPKEISGISVAKREFDGRQIKCTLYIPLPVIAPDAQEKGEETPKGPRVPFLRAVLQAISGINKEHWPTRTAIDHLLAVLNQKEKIGSSGLGNRPSSSTSSSSPTPEPSSDAQTPPTIHAPNDFWDLLTWEGDAYDWPESPAAIRKNEASSPSDFVTTADDTLDNQPRPKGEYLERARGSAFAYTVSPLEKSQRLSTHAQAARSFEFALSLAAKLQTKGLEGGLDAGAVRESAGIAEAFENQPIVVGFAERRSRVEREVRGYDPVYLAEYQSPQVGWVFGPKVRLNPSKSTLDLVHTFAAHEVSADLSLPGWWPRVDVVLETAWIGNLHSTGRPIRLDDETTQGFHRERFSVALPVNGADLDGLTEYLASRLVGRSLPAIVIQHVDPFFVSACTKDVTLLVKGANVWRSTRAYLSGIEADEVSVLPDMEGVALKFDLDKLFNTRNSQVHDLGLDQDVRLSLWTRNGSDGVTLSLLGNRNATTCNARASVSPSRRRGYFGIVEISPSQICADATEVTFLMKGTSSSRPLAAVFGNHIEENLSPFTGSSRIFQVTFSGGPFGIPDQTLPLAVTDGDDISTNAIRLVNCKKPATKPAPKPSTGKVAQTYTIAKVVAKKYQFSVKIKGFDKSFDNNNLRVGVLPKIRSRSKNDKWIVSDKMPSQMPNSTDTYEATFSVEKTATGNPQAAFAEARKIDFALLRAGAANPDVLGQVSGEMVYYPSENAAKASVSKLTKLSKEGETIDFTLPEYHDSVFPGIPKATVTAAVAGHPKIKLKVNIDLSKIKDRKIRSTIKLVDDESEVEYGKLPKGRHNVEFKFTGDNVPEIKDGTLDKPTGPPK